MGSKSTKAFSELQEKRVANYLGWSVVAASGAISTLPGDVQGQDWLGECKTHIEPNHSIIFKVDVWAKLCAEAMYRHRFPALIVDDGSQDIEKTWVVFSKLANPCNLKVVRYPFSIQTNLAFNHERLVSRFLEEYDAGAEYVTAYSVELNGEEVYLTRLSEFKEMFVR